jgi:hypothetical protein
MKNVIYFSFVCLGLVSSGSAVAGEEAVVAATPESVVVAEVEQEGSCDSCNSSSCLVRKRVGLFNVVRVYDSCDGCCSTRTRVVTPRCAESCGACEPCVDSCESSCVDSCVYHARNKVFGRRVFRRRSVCSTSCCN